MTAAHCEFESSDLVAVLGAHRINKFNNGEVVKRVSKIIRVKDEILKF